MRKSAHALAALLLVWHLPLAAQTAESTSRPARPVVVGSKIFAESRILAEIFAQTLEADGIEVDRRFGLGSTEILMQGLRAGAVDVYPEYTGTGLLAVLGQDLDGMDGGQVFDRVSREFRDRWGLRWLPPLGFENTYAIAVRGTLARQSGIVSLTDLSRSAPDLVAGFTPDFLGRADGLPGLREAYGIEFGDTRSLVQAVKYEALEAGAVDVIDGYSTDGRLGSMDAVVLRDDLGFFPPYDAAALVGRTVAEGRPDVIASLSRLSGRIDEARMRALNALVEVEGMDEVAVARRFLDELGIVLAGAPDPGGRSLGSARRPGTRTRGDDNLLGYMFERRAELARNTARHLLLVLISLILGIGVALPLGLAIQDWDGAETVIRGVGVLQTIPSIALLAFMIPLLGIGFAPAVAALFLYSLLPILRNTFQGVRDADSAAVESARALGMTRGQLLRYVRVPLAAPAIMAGIRVAAVVNVGTATLAAFIGAGGLGDPIVAGLTLSDTRMILSGALPAAVLALVVDGALGMVERRVSPGVRGEK